MICIENQVDIEINGVPVDIHMKLGDSGEAYFLQECEDYEDEEDICSKSTESINEDSCNSSHPQSITPDMDVSNDNTSTCDKENIVNSIKAIDVSTQSTIHSETKSETVINNTGQDKCQKRQRRKRKSKLSANKHASYLDHSKSLQSHNDIRTGLDVEESLNSTYSENEFHPFSDSEISMIPTKYKKDSFTDSFEYKSDSEYEIYKANVGDKTQGQDNISWGWGELPNVQKESLSLSSKKEENILKPSSPSSSVLGNVLNFIKKEKDADKEEDKGIYLDELDPNDMTPEVAAKYFTKFRSGSSYSAGRPNIQTSSDDDFESGTGPSLSNSPHSIDFPFPHNEFSEFDDKNVTNFDLVAINKLYHDMSMSLCGKIEDLVSNPTDSERFLQSIISFDDFAENPLSIIDNPNLVIRMGGKYFTWKMASSIILSLLMFQRPLSEKTLMSLKEKCIPKKNLPQNPKSSWRSWFRSNTEVSQNQADDGSINPNAQTSGTNSENSSNFDANSFNSSFDKMSLSKSNTLEYVSDDETLNILLANGNRKKNLENRKVKYKKVLRLSSDIIQSLNLKPDSNEVSFSVTTAYQGTTMCKSKIFLWRYDDKVVISDIDGTITKSDVLGHILPYIGKDWAQMGVTKLFTNIYNNGYKFLYLSARAIGQARGTREYLGALCQEEINLPDGPLLLSPTSLLSALHR